MADQNADLWPVAKFFFTVDIDGEVYSFQEVTGLKATIEAYEYRAGDDPSLTKKKAPGLRKYDNITLKKGVFRDDTRLHEWFKLVQQGGDEFRKDLTISLLGDAADDVILSWRIVRAFPVSMASPDLNAEGNEASIETIELAHEGVFAE